MMPQKLLWTKPRDACVLRLRRQGESWDSIARALRISRNAAIERGRRIGARLPPRQMAIVRLVDPDRPALPSGHAITWGTLIRGTVLEGEPYPAQPPMGRDRCAVVGEVC